MRKHKFTHTHIEHHKDGSHTIHHVHEEGPHKDVKSAVGDHDELMDHMMDNTSEPNPGEDQDENEEALEEAIHPGIHKEVAKAQKEGDKVEEK